MNICEFQCMEDLGNYLGVPIFHSQPTKQAIFFLFFWIKLIKYYVIGK